MGGFASGRRHVESAALALSAYFDEEVVGVSFREGMEDPARLARLLNGANVHTHSAGMVAAYGSSPESITAFAPPVPVWAPILAARALASTGELAVAAPLPTKSAEVGGYLRHATAELGAHLHGNIKWLSLIARFDALDAAVAAEQAGIPTQVVFMSNDRLFQPGRERIKTARSMGANVVRIVGNHDEFMQNPSSSLDAAMAARGAIELADETRLSGLRLREA